MHLSYGIPNTIYVLLQFITETYDNNKIRCLLAYKA